MKERSEEKFSEYTPYYQSIVDYFYEVLQLKENEFDLITSTRINNRFDGVNNYHDNYSHIFKNLIDGNYYCLENRKVHKIDAPIEE